VSSSPPKADDEFPPRRQRRALTHVGGDVEVGRGSPELVRVLRTALDVRSNEERVLAHVHGFHSYPARLHPDTASALIHALSRPGDSVLDPFCGSGTVLVVARLGGRRAFGSDLNPLAVELASLKANAAGPGFAEALYEAAEEVAEHAKERQKKKLGPTERYGPEDRALFTSYVLLELDGLRSAIDKLPRGGVPRALRLVHSAILTKVSNKAGDATDREQSKRIARGFAIRFFVMKARELAARLDDYEALLPERAPFAEVELCDARRLDFVRDRSIELIVTSPPYPGVYDYFEHHRLRLRWLGMDGRDFEQGEMGSRRAANQPGASADWERDFASTFQEMARVLRPRGHAALLVADSVIGGRALKADEWLPRLALGAGLSVVGHAAQRREHFHRPTARAFERTPRREHLFVLQRD